MGLYDDRLADLSERRRGQRARLPFSPIGRSHPKSLSIGRLRPKSLPVDEAHRRSMSVQSLLFDRNAGWTPATAKAWAKAHGYKHGKVDVTDQYVRLRQFDPKGFKVERTVTFGRGIRAVVAREGVKSMTKKTRRKKTSTKRARRRTKTAPRKTSRRGRRRTTETVKHRRRRRRRSMVMEAPRPVRRRRRRSHVQAWRGDPAGHAKATRKGWRKKKRSAPRRRKRSRSRRARETTMLEARRHRRRPVRRRRARRARETVMETPRHHRRRSHRRRMSEPRGGSGFGLAEFAVATLTGGIGFVLADGLDRFLATYNPAGTTAQPVTKFTSTGAGTLGNTLNVASRPSLIRVGAAVGVIAVPIVGAVAAKRHPMVRAAFEGAALGAGISLFKMVWNNLIMPLLAPSDTSVGSLRKSFIARLYPAEVSAHINMAANQTAVASATSGALSGASQLGVGADVGPFALAGDSPYPDAAQALRASAGVQDQYPSLQNVMGTGGPGSNYPTAAQVMGTGAAATPSSPASPSAPGWQPGPPAGPGPGPQAQPHTDPACGCIGDGDQYGTFLGLGDGPKEEVLYDTGSN